jgi:protein gp37
MAARFSNPGAPFHLFADRHKSGSKWTGKVDLVERHLQDPLKWRHPKRIFVNSMSDLFHENLPDEAIDQVFAVMALCPQHTFQILTKRPERALQWFNKRPAKFVDGNIQRTMPGFICRPLLAGLYGTRESLLSWQDRWPLQNVWLGVSVEDQKNADERIPFLLQTPAAVRFISYEPALGPIDLRAALSSGRLHWVIVGGESGPGARPFDIRWARDIVRQCHDAKVACFVKQMGAVPIIPACRQNHYEWGEGKFDYWQNDQSGMWRIKLKDRTGGDWDEWPSFLRYREFPVGRSGKSRVNELQEINSENS